LKIRHGNSEERFETDQLLGRYELWLGEENAEFLKLFIENEGDDKFNEIVYNLLNHHYKKNTLLEQLRYKMSQRQN